MMRTSPHGNMNRYTSRLIVTLPRTLTSLFLFRNVRSQAVGRVHRMGQKREVHVYRMAMTTSIDERILEVGASRRGLSGNIKEDKAALNIREFDLLFNKVPMTANPSVESGGSSSEATARAAALASIAANNVLAAANTAQRIASSQNAAGIRPPTLYPLRTRLLSALLASMSDQFKIHIPYSLPLSSQGGAIDSVAQAAVAVAHANAVAAAVAARALNASKAQSARGESLCY
jgi:hypothetical protein